MTNIKKLYKEWQALQPLDEKLERNINQQFMIDFNYNSNHMEGNTLTYGQTKLLLLFGDTIGNASIQDYEEMKAHNVGLELMKVEAKDKNRMLSEHFIRELNKTIYYIFLRHNYPMLVIRTDDRNNYLKVLHQCDLLTGKIPYDGAHATLQQAKPLVDYISGILENKLTALIRLAKGEISEFIEAKDDTVEKTVEKILNILQNNPKTTQADLVKLTGLSRRGVEWNITKLKTDGIIERIGGRKEGYWKIK